jgi:hypothetical protein
MDLGAALDISAHGWGGAVKNVTESETSPAAG